MSNSSQQTVKPSVCPLDCPDTCSLQVTVENGEIRKVKGSRANPYTAGAICDKVARYYPDFVHGEQRLRTPLLRTGKPGSGEFKPIKTNVPGIEICEHLPLMAQQMDKFCLLRSMHHGDPVHGTACSQMITGRPHQRPGTTDTLAPDDWPSLSSLVMRFGKPHGGLPPSIVLPWYLMFKI